MARSATSRLTTDPLLESAPIRAEIFSAERFEQHAISLADSQTVADRRRAPVVSILDRLAEDYQALVSAYEATVADIQAQRPITPAAEWLADNFHVVETHSRQIRRDLPKSYFRQLPKLSADFLEGHPRIVGIIWAYIAHTDSLFDPDLLARYVRAYESRRALTLGELWAVAITLRLLLIENLRRLAEQVVTASADRRAADALADQVLAAAVDEHGGRDEITPDEITPEDVPANPSRAFTVQLIRRLADSDRVEAAAWIQQYLDERNLDAQELVQLEHQSQASATVTMRNIFTSLRLITDVNWEDWLESVSLIEFELRRQPSYRALDFRTRDMYRSAVEQLARGAEQSEIVVARAVVHRAESGSDELTRDVGYWLIDKGRRSFEEQLGYRPRLRELAVRTARSMGLTGYLVSLTLCTLALLVLTLSVLNLIAGGLSVPVLFVLALLAGFPMSELALGVVNYWSARTFPAQPIPGLALRAGVPAAARTLVVMPTMLTSVEEVDELVERLEVHYLANTGGEIYFALATDWADSPQQRTDADDEVLERARDRIAALNTEHGDHRFFLFHRERRWNPSEGVWMGWERKRGKLLELGLLLRGRDDTSFIVRDGVLPGPFRYVITLDSDTRLPREAARRLVGKMAHPLNRPVYDPESGRIVRGYGILQPRVTPSLPTMEGTSLFQRVYSTPRGLDPYAFAVSDVYQDLFGEGSFAGKGIYELDAVHRCIDGRVPENSLLSHDLLEGNYARSGLVTDVEVVEEFPLTYAVAASRTHRWTRGDWQLLPWLTSRREGLSALGMWKMIDNLRRSISPVALVATILFALWALPAPAALAAFLILAGTFYLPPLLPLLGRALLRRRDVTRESQLRGFADDIVNGLRLSTMNVVFLAHQAAMMVDAVVRTLFRLVRGRRLLEWTTADAAARRVKGTPVYYVALMWTGLIPPVLALAIGASRGPGSFVVSLVPAVTWLFAPYVGWLASRPVDLTDEDASADDLDELRVVARRTWRFFETFVGPDTNHLPPDNFQEEPAPVVANRTSPTNIGLYLLVLVSARDFGWIGLRDTLTRLEATMATVTSLKLHRGHLYNWYDTSTLAPLHPRYVSTVDSGNLAGHLIALAGACREWLAEAEHTVDERAGTLDALAILRQNLDGSGLPGAGRDKVTSAVDALAQAVRSQAPGPLRDLDTLTPKAEQLVAVIEREAGGPGAPGDRTGAHAAGAGPDADAGSGSGSGAGARLEPDLLDWAHALRDGLASLAADRDLGPVEREDLDERIRRLESTATEFAAQMDFAFLYNRTRSLLSIGYQVETDSLDDNCYDLLASEARLASFVAIAKGDLKTRHWFLLGRTVTAVAGGAALLSWSGSMFEYLMPPLVMRSPASGLLDRTCKLAVRRQIAYGAENGVPWGVSESAFNARDLNLTYQYSPFGVPGLGIVRGLADNLVIAPYATGLASMIEPGAAARNYAALRKVGALGRYGYYEALDYTPRRLPPDEKCVIVRCFMAHHQGMTIVAIHNAVHDGLMRERFHAEPLVRASELLLQERSTRDVPITYARREELARESIRTVAPPAERTYEGFAALQPAVHHMSNGTLSVTLTPWGGGQVRWKGMAITRWHPDPTSEETGDYVYLRDENSGAFWSAGAMPVMIKTGRYSARFDENRVEFRRKRGSLLTELEYHLSPESDALVRKLTIRNTKNRNRRLTVTSYAELVLANMRDDDAHPVFSRMFVHTEFLPDKDAVIATRRRRNPTDSEVWVGHMVRLGAHTTGGGSVKAETDRSAFLGRNGTVRDPAAMAGPPVSGETGYVLDPVLSLSRRVRVPGSGRAEVLLWTFLADSREELLNLIDRHRSDTAYDRIAMLGWTHSQVQQRHLRISADDATRFQTLAGHVLFGHHALQSAPERVAELAGPQSALWQLSISGDLPILLVHIDDISDLRLVREAVRAFEFWRTKRFSVDLVILNDRSTSYVQDLQQALEALAGAIEPRTGAPDSSGRIYVLRRDQVPPDALAVLTACARVTLFAAAGQLADQLPALESVAPAPALSDVPAQHQAAHVETPVDTDELLYFNGYGGFSPDGREYVTVLRPGRSTPAPWTNVVANEQFGFHATAEGAGYTWWRNSRDNQLTPWRNDPVSTPQTEVFYVRDEESGAVWSPTAAPLHQGTHVARHGFGYTRYEHSADSVSMELLQLVPLDDAVKVSRLRLTNTGSTPRRLAVTWYAEPVLGMNRPETARHLLTWLDESTSALFVRNPWTTQFPDQVVFADLAGAQESWSGSRREFLGMHGSLASPQAIVTGAPLSGYVGAGLDPCVALQEVVDLAPGESRDVVALLGAAPDTGAAADLLARYREISPQALFDEVAAHWQERLGTIQVRTPDPSFDLMLNGWLLYQTLACRMLARSGYYQASGAFGFRDQLQDSMALVLIDPATARGHLLRAAGRQFLEGDVQHWWLPAGGTGIRTRMSDDVVWLAHATARYVEVTGDVGVLDEQVPYLEGRQLEEGEHEAFFTPETSQRTGSLYEHCVRALEVSFTSGRNGLPLMGTGDWNDGMNRVGAGGQGESVWLGWFLHTTLSRFLPLVQARRDLDFAQRCHVEQDRLRRNLERNAWDGRWYRRAYFDDGTPLGSASNTECRIDAIAQSWAVLSGACDQGRAEQAMDAVHTHLVGADGVVRLFTPPFDLGEHDPGYIAAYPPGVRENGGQYTHGGTWSIFADAALGRDDRAGALFATINPINHALNRRQADTYRVEPYVVAADVYSVAPHVGRGGWTWYTGSSAWLYRAGIEAVLGMQRQGSAVRLTPCLPPSWQRATVSYTVGDSRYDIEFVTRGRAPRAVTHVELDGARIVGDTFMLQEDGRVHTVRVLITGVDESGAPIAASLEGASPDGSQAGSDVGSLVGAGEVVDGTVVDRSAVDGTVVDDEPGGLVPAGEPGERRTEGPEPVT